MPLEAESISLDNWDEHHQQTKHVISLFHNKTINVCGSLLDRCIHFQVLRNMGVERLAHIVEGKYGNYMTDMI